VTRAIAAWRNLESERRPAVLAAFGLFVSMLLPWYSKSDTVVVERSSKAGHAAAVASQTSLNAFQAFSFVEAAVLLTSGGVLFLLFKRAEGARFRMPGGDGTIVMAAGAWAALLVFYRLLDKPGLKGNQQVTATVGVEWGIFLALLIAISLAYTGQRMRLAAAPEPPARRPHRPAPQEGWVEHPERAAAPASSPASRTPVRARRPSGARAPSPAEVPEWHDEPTELRLAPATAQGRRARAPAPGEHGAGAAADRPARPAAAARSRYPPAPAGGASAPPEQLSFEDPPPARRD
jgi:hypothetical protein